MLSVKKKKSTFYNEYLSIEASSTVISEQIYVCLFSVVLYSKILDLLDSLILSD